MRDVTHLALLKEVDRCGTGAEAISCVLLGAFDLGAPKKDVILALLVFLLSANEAERWSAFRFNAGLTMAKERLVVTEKKSMSCSTECEESQ